MRLFASLPCHNEEGHELKIRRCVKGWAGWTPVSKAEKAELRELVLCPRSEHDDATLPDGGRTIGPSTWYVGGRCGEGQSN